VLPARAIEQSSKAVWLPGVAHCGALLAREGVCKRHDHVDGGARCLDKVLLQQVGGNVSLSLSSPPPPSPPLGLDIYASWSQANLATGAQFCWPLGKTQYRRGHRRGRSTKNACQNPAPGLNVCSRSPLRALGEARSFVAANIGKSCGIARAAQYTQR
jgi:hypothetical protein